MIPLRSSLKHSAIAFLASITSGLAQSPEWQRGDSPFTLGEGQPVTDATCETVKHWVNHAPNVDGRVSFAITGQLAHVHWDGTLAYLIMCDPAGVQVMCVTYSAEGREVGETVSFAGGYAPAGPKRVILDPCLASEE